MKYVLTILLFINLFIGFAQVDHWETIIYDDDVWKYRLGTSEPAENWKDNSFEDSDWLEGKGSIGYGDNDDNTIIDKTLSLYMRRTFNIVDKSNIKSIIFHADYDDGFVAYLNGTEIARANLIGEPPAFDEGTPEFREALMFDGGLPIPYILSNNQVDALLQNGENILTIQTHNYEGLASSDLTTRYWFSVGIQDESYDYGTVPEWFVMPDFQTKLPIIKINTWGDYIPDEPSIQGEMSIIYDRNGGLNSNFDEANEFFGNISIERRGQTSQVWYPKNNYGIETKDENWEDKDVGFLNFPEEEDWILHGPYSDKTLIRNVLAMEMGRSIGQYASRTRLVELVINDQYEGVYVLMERIKRDKNRVDIAKLNPNEISGDDLTGGYIFKLDKGETDWYSTYDMVNNPGNKLRYQMVSPKSSKIVPEQLNYIKSVVDSFEYAIHSFTYKIGNKRYNEFIDLESFADHFIIQELTKNIDAYRISAYMYKDKDSKDKLIKAGPIWDFNLAFGNAYYCDAEKESGWVYDVHCGIFNPFWWGRMFEDETFTNAVKCRWIEHRSGPLRLDSIFQFIDEKTELLKPVIERNFKRWPVIGEYVIPNAVVLDSYDEEVEYLKDFIAKRMAWMDDNIFGNCTANSTDVNKKQNDLVISPNPSDGEFNIKIKFAHRGSIEVLLFDTFGNKIETQKFGYGYEGLNDLEIKLNKSLNPGIYFVEIKLDKERIGMKPLLVHF